MCEILSFSRLTTQNPQDIVDSECILNVQSKSSVSQICIVKLHLFLKKGRSFISGVFNRTGRVITILCCNFGHNVSITLLILITYSL